METKNSKVDNFINFIRKILLYIDCKQFENEIIVFKLF
ncbi:hypothetical protein JCM19274_791 [Algibacter lectus]|uniref:Uncharacterized protein n=1 Tax=Algibacter lectus TaxID=221126 RepID=A0A090WU41_9FLAO|nr:hypothetical protein JCM19274_791 [Algibacter lectus]